MLHKQSGPGFRATDPYPGVSKKSPPPPTQKRTKFHVLESSQEGWMLLLELSGPFEDFKETV
jgi:hypothetical protein